MSAGQPASSSVRAHQQRASGVALDQQDYLPVAQQRSQGSRHYLLRIAAGHDDDDVGAVGRGAQIDGREFYRGKAALLPLDIKAPKGADVG